MDYSVAQMSIQNVKLISRGWSYQIRSYLAINPAEELPTARTCQRSMVNEESAWATTSYQLQLSSFILVYSIFHVCRILLFTGILVSSILLIAIEWLEKRFGGMLANLASFDHLILTWNRAAWNRMKFKRVALGVALGVFLGDDKGDKEHTEPRRTTRRVSRIGRTFGGCKGPKWESKQSIESAHTATWQIAYEGGLSMSKRLSIGSDFFWLLANCSTWEGLLRLLAVYNGLQSPHLQCRIYTFDRIVKLIDSPRIAVVGISKCLKFEMPEIQITSNNLNGCFDVHSDGCSLNGIQNHIELNWNLQIYSIH